MLHKYEKGTMMTFPLEFTEVTEEQKEWDDQYLMPMEAKKIQLEVMEMCDQMEYDGSPMFDCYPDRIIIGRMVQKSVENGVTIHITMHWYRSCCVRR